MPEREVDIRILNCPNGGKSWRFHDRANPLFAQSLNPSCETVSVPVLLVSTASTNLNLNPSTCMAACHISRTAFAI
jgi:hypothetical protein